MQIIVFYVIILFAPRMENIKYKMHHQLIKESLKINNDLSIKAIASPFMFFVKKKISFVLFFTVVCCCCLLHGGNKKIANRLFIIHTGLLARCCGC